MPQISKVRIVNFQYNKGKRMIADELYDFADSQGEQAFNVLINLENGGGKSVLVQLMMQPIIPKAKIAGRKIESFFDRNSDHCFVLLEWFKDNSPEKLLTGIAMSASEANGEENEQERGRSVKYYTFYTNYRMYNSRYDIINMPLSKRENGRFIAADFDEVRRLARQSNGILQYYSSDDRGKWKKKLSEYGLIQDEWHLAETLNSVEGGLSKFFEGFKTSDMLVDQLLVKNIENKIGQGADNLREDTSLSSMLLAYAHQYASKQDVLQEQKILQSFVEDMDDLKPRADNLWNVQDGLQAAIRNLFGLSGALTVKLQDLQTRSAQTDERLQQIKDTIRHIEWEEASLAFYTAEESFETARINYEEAEKLVNELEIKKEQLSHQADVLACANQYEKLKRVKTDLAAVQDEINEKEKGSDGADRLRQYRYSTLVAAENELDDCTRELKKCRAELEDSRQETENRSTALRQARNKQDRKKQEYDQIVGGCSQVEKQTDQNVEKMSDPISRRLDGYYSQDELNEYVVRTDQEKQAIEENLRRNQEQQEKIRQERDSIPDKKSERTDEKNRLALEAEKIGQALAQYDEQESKLVQICSQYNLNLASRFTDQIISYLEQEKRNKEADHTECMRKLDMADQEIKAVRNGYLHVPQAVIEYLNSTGIQYTTCEKYLLEQVQNEQITHERLSEILANYPASAYGILLKDEEKHKLFEFDREEWLPSMIPLFNYGHMDQILQVKRTFDGSLAFYSQAYFNDAEHYGENLEKKREDIYKRQQLIMSQMQLLGKQIDQAKAFDYEENWKSKRTSELDTLRQKMEDAEQKIQLLEKQKEELEQTLQDVQAAANELQEQSRAIEKQRELLKQIQEDILKEKELGDERDRIHGEWLDAQDLTDEAQASYDDSRDIMNRRELAVERLEKRESQLDEIHFSVEGCKETEVIPGRAEELYQAYTIIKNDLKSKLETLETKRQYLSEQKQTCEEEIKKKQVEPEEYQTAIYSEEQENAVHLRLVEVGKQEKEAQEAYHECGICKGKEEARFGTAQSNLKEFGDVLDKSEIQNNFDDRKKAARNESERLQQEKYRIEKLHGDLSRTQERLEDEMIHEDRPENVPSVVLADDVKRQYRDMKSSRDAKKKQLEAERSEMEKKLSQLQAKYHTTTCGVAVAIEGLSQLMEPSVSGGDSYFTLGEHILQEQKNAQFAISQNETDLQEIENQRLDLIRHCTIQGKYMYDGLNRMASSSKVTVYDGKPKQQMIRFNIPNEVDPVRVNVSIEERIDAGVRDIVSMMAEMDVTEAEIKKKADKTVSSSMLLRSYIGQDSVLVQAYKIDQNPQNAEYRTWEQTQVNNSGAEKFVVYFAVILSVMNYTRSEIDGVNDKNLRSTLILDNPFGATSSKHILEPMFAIARHFRVQLVCLSDINKAEVINCFDTVIKAIVKRKPASNNEILTHEGNETIEHGFYRAEQISI